MAYATRTDLTTLSLSAGALSGVSTDKQDAALEAASRIADGYLNARYRLPLLEYGSDLRKAVCDMAAFILLKARGFDPQTADAEVLHTGYRDAERWLEGIAAGKISPYGMRDSSAGSVNVEDASPSRGDYVVQHQEGNPERVEFWTGTTTAGGGGVGTPKRRGW